MFQGTKGSQFQSSRAFSSDQAGRSDGDVDVRIEGRGLGSDLVVVHGVRSACLAQGRTFFCARNLHSFVTRLDRSSDKLGRLAIVTYSLL